MPKFYLPARPERMLSVTWNGTHTYKVIEWATGTTHTTRSTTLATRHESISDAWIRRIQSTERRVRDWDVEHFVADGTYVTVLRALPTPMGTTDRIDMLLSDVFQASCRAAMRHDRAEVERLDRRHNAISRAYYGARGITIPVPAR